MFFMPVGYNLAVFVCESLMTLGHDKAERELEAFASFVRHAMHMVLVEEVTAVIMQFVNRHFASSL